MKIISKFLFIILIFIFSCATPPPKRINTQNGILGINIYLPGPAKFFDSNAGIVYFVKINEDDDLINNVEIFKSNYQLDEYVYLFNAAPGKYAVVIGLPKPGSTSLDIKYILTKDFINETKTILKPNDIAFMGRFVVDKLSYDPNFKNFDEIQLQYAMLISPHRFNTITSIVSDISGTLSGKQEYLYSTTLREKIKNKNLEIDFLKRSLEVVKDTKWNNLFNNTLTNYKE